MQQAVSNNLMSASNRDVQEAGHLMQRLAFDLVYAKGDLRSRGQLCYRVHHRSELITVEDDIFRGRRVNRHGHPRRTCRILNYFPTAFEPHEAIEAIEEWLFENFEDPANSTPHDSGEGGYQYIWGGPDDTRDIIENVFADIASDALISAAVDSLNRESHVWVPSIRRRRAPDDDYVPDPPSDAAALHAELQQRLLLLEEAVTALQVSPPGLGHNNPPEEIEPIPYTTGSRLLQPSWC